MKVDRVVDVQRCDAIGGSYVIGAGCDSLGPATAGHGALPALHCALACKFHELVHSFAHLFSETHTKRLTKHINGALWSSTGRLIKCRFIVGSVLWQTFILHHFA